MSRIRLPRLALFPAVFLVFSQCSFQGAAPASAPTASLPVAAQVTALVFSRSGALWYVESRGGRCSLWTVDVQNPAPRSIEELQFCPRDLQIDGDGALFGMDGKNSFTAQADQSQSIIYGNLTGIASAENYVKLTTAGMVWVHDGSPTPLEGNLRNIRFTSGGEALIAIRKAPGGEQLIRLGSAPDKSVAISGTYPNIDSFDLSPDGKELVFSAKRATGFDAAIGSTETLVEHWIDPDPADEVEVAWAPRGHKVSLVVRRAGGNFIRTVHVPTSAELTAPFPDMEIERTAWDPAAERLAVVSSSPTKSDEISLIGYDGKGMTTILPSAAAVAREQDIVPGDNAAIMFAPPTVRYGERYPVVVFAGVRDAQRWSDARSDIAADTDAGIVITGTGITSLTSSFWSSVTALPWADPSQLFVVTPDPPGASNDLPRGSVLLLPQPLAKNLSAPAGVSVRAMDGSGPEGFEMRSAAFIIDTLGKRSH